MMAEVFKLGDLVWAKMKGFSSWPGRVASPRKGLKRPPTTKKLGWQCIFFFGTNNYAWVERNNIRPYFAFKDKLIKSNKSAPFREAIRAVEIYIAASGKKFDSISCSDTEVSMLTENGTAKKKKSQESRIKIRMDHKVVKRTSDSPGNIADFKKRTTASETVDLNLACTSTNKGGAPLNNSKLSADVTKREIPNYIEVITQTLKEDTLPPSDLKFGFLGLGIMGSGIVKYLLISGHSVVVWNRTPDKCRDFVKAGAMHGLTPSDVVAAADITFSCVSDPQAVKEMVFGNCGVLSAISSCKGYVEMTGIDAETSQDIAEAINVKGGRYLEAQLQGSKIQAEEGTLVVLAAGDRTLFDDCQSCFQVIGKSSFYLGEVGNASKMNLVLQLMTGVTLAGLAEGMALADRAGLRQKDVLEVLELTSLACPAMVDKAKVIIEGSFPTHLPLQHMQKDLKLSLYMGDQMCEPLPLTASTNELFKHAKRLGYGSYDVSAVYIRARF